MFPEIFGMNTYNLLSTVSIIVTLLASFFLYPLKKNALGFYSTKLVDAVSRKNKKIANGMKVFLVSFESLLMAYMLTNATNYNVAFGDMVDTGANYFATLIWYAPSIIILCFVLMINPLKQLDMTTLLAGLFLFIVKLSCFGNGCCWGIPWEHGMYNYNEYHPGYQVPVQLIEALCALAIFFFLLWYRKKAKIGTLYPMYVILYSATRFCSEFFRREENVLWIFKTYHLLCMAGFVIGLILFFIIRAYGQNMSDRFEAIPDRVKARINGLKEKAAAELALEKAEQETLEAERLEKAKAARENAKARNKSKK